MLSAITADAMVSGGGGGGPSDQRLKADITRVGQTSDGITLYAFRYHGDERRFVGVMAQDLLASERFRHAVHRGKHGFYVVDYAALGLRMMTIEEWQRRADRNSSVLAA